MSRRPLATIWPTDDEIVCVTKALAMVLPKPAAPAEEAAAKAEPGEAKLPMKVDTSMPIIEATRKLVASPITSLKPKSFSKR